MNTRVIGLITLTVCCLIAASMTMIVYSFQKSPDEHAFLYPSTAIGDAFPTSGAHVWQLFGAELFQKNISQPIFTPIVQMTSANVYQKAYHKLGYVEVAHYRYDDCGSTVPQPFTYSTVVGFEQNSTVWNPVNGSGSQTPFVNVTPNGHIFIESLTNQNVSVEFVDSTTLQVYKCENQRNCSYFVEPLDHFTQDDRIQCISPLIAYQANATYNFTLTSGSVKTSHCEPFQTCKWILDTDIDPSDQDCYQARWSVDAADTIVYSFVKSKSSEASAAELSFAAQSSISASHSLRTAALVLFGLTLVLYIVAAIVYRRQRTDNYAAV